MPGREDRTQSLIERCELDYVVGSVHFLGDLAVDFDRFDIWASAAQPRGGLAALLRDARRGGAQRPVRHPRPPRPRQDVGRGAAAPAGRPAPLLRAGARGDRRVGDRRRGLDRRAAQAGRRDLPGAGVPRRRRSRPGRRSRSRATRTCPSRSASATTRRSSCSTGSACSELAVFERRQRRLEPIGPMSVRSGIGYDSHRLVAGRPLVLGGVELDSERRARRPLRRRRADPRRDRRAARRGRARRHRHALPRHRRALARRRLDRAAVRGRRARARRRATRSSTSTRRSRSRRRSSAARASGCASGSRSALGVDSVGGQREGDDRRGDRLRRARRGRGGAGDRHARR